MTGESDDSAATARRLLARIGTAALATLDASGAPFASYVNIATAEDNTPLLLLSRLAVHTRNLERDPRASLLLVAELDGEGESLAATRLTVTGRIKRDTGAEGRARYLDRNPEASRYAGFRDFDFYRFEVEAGHLVAGFGRIVTLARADLIAPVTAV